MSSGKTALKSVAPNAPEKIFDWPEAWKKIWPNLFKGGGDPPTPSPPGGAELLKRALHLVPKLVTGGRPLLESPHQRAWASVRHLQKYSGIHNCTSGIMWCIRKTRS